MTVASAIHVKPEDNVKIMMMTMMIMMMRMLKMNTDAPFYCFGTKPDPVPINDFKRIMTETIGSLASRWAAGAARIKPFTSTLQICEEDFVV